MRRPPSGYAVQPPMAVSAHTVLCTTCDVYDAEGDPPTARAVAEAMDAATEGVRPVLRSLCRAEFLAATAGGFRPTVTARELLDRGIHLGDVAAVDVVEEARVQHSSRYGQ